MRLSPLCLSLLLLNACAISPNDSPSGQAQAIDNPLFAAIADTNHPLERDRRAILAMQGEYEVGFQFQETVRLAPDYQYHDRKETGGLEAVVVIADEPDFISLQHLLLVGDGHVIKHWRQDWFLDAGHRFEFSQDQTWRVVPVDQSSGRWTQCVYEVSDAPRYCGTGDWNHRYGVSTWTSDRSWRPLPRREYTVREDYNALNGENRHTVTPFGWSHEQDNTKVLRDGARTERTLVREFGFNDYRHISGVDFSPVYDYWQRTAGYWDEVRAAWNERLQPGNRLELLTAVDGMPIIEATFSDAEVVRADGDPGRWQTQAEAILSRWTRVSASHRQTSP